MRDYAPIFCLAQTTFAVPYDEDEYVDGRLVRTTRMDEERVQCHLMHGHSGPHRATLYGEDKLWSE